MYVLLAVLALFMAAFATDTDLVLGSHTSFLDQPALHEAVAHRDSALNTVMEGISDTAELPLAAVVFAAAAVLAWRRRSWQPVVLMAAAGVLSVLAATVVKDLTDRTRPPHGYWVVHETDFSFPSRHTTMAAALLFMLAFLLTQRLASRAAVGAVWVGALVLIVLVGTSRVYLGVHWATDVLGGFTLGTSLTLVLMALALSWRGGDGAAAAGRSGDGPRVGAGRE